MRVYLFGGADNGGQVAPELKLIEQVIKDSGVKQVLHIPFARTVAKEPEWEGDWYRRYMSLPDVEYLNASNPSDIAKANNPLVFVSGGGQRKNLLDKINASPELLSFIKNTPYLIAESSGAKVLGEYLREDGGATAGNVIPGLGTIKDTIVEVHYSEQHREQLLREEMKLKNVKYGIGIDCVTAIAFTLGEFSEKYEKIGSGSVEVLFAR